MTVIALDLWPFDWGRDAVKDGGGNNAPAQASKDDSEEYGLVEDFAQFVAASPTH